MRITLQYMSVNVLKCLYVSSFTYEKFIFKANPRQYIQQYEIKSSNSCVEIASLLLLSYCNYLMWCNKFLCTKQKLSCTFNLCIHINYDILGFGKWYRRPICWWYHSNLKMIEYWYDVMNIRINHWYLFCEMIFHFSNYSYQRYYLFTWRKND